jgi:Mg/Co/Ni transporter MgtE
MPDWLRLCFTKSVICRAVGTALIVGAILAVINYGDVILRGQMTQPQIFKLMLTFLVPYCVSVYSSVSAILEIKSKPKIEFLKR